MWDQRTAEAYTTPIPAVFEGLSEIIVSGGDYVTGHDPETGAEIWRLGYNPRESLAWRLVPSPVAAEGLIFGLQPRHGPLFAFRLGRLGETGFSDVSWTYKGSTPDVITPLCYRGRLYIIHGSKRVMTCLDPKTGEKIWEAQLDVLVAPSQSGNSEPGTLLRNRIPIRTDHWDITRPGFPEADTVAPCGNSITRRNGRCFRISSAPLSN